VESLGVAGLASAFEAYVAKALALRQARAGQIELLLGFETEILPPNGWLALMEGLRAAHPFDYVVGSVHDICRRWVDYSAEAFNLLIFQPSLPPDIEALPI
jgi:histidinol-phosphatase (PHP family)